MDSDEKSYCRPSLKVGCSHEPSEFGQLGVPSSHRPCPTKREIRATMVERAKQDASVIGETLLLGDDFEVREGVGTIARMVGEGKWEETARMVRRS